MLPLVNLRRECTSPQGEPTGVALHIGLDLAAHARNLSVDVLYLVSGRHRLERGHRLPRASPTEVACWSHKSIFPTIWTAPGCSTSPARRFATLRTTVGYCCATTSGTRSAIDRWRVDQCDRHGQRTGVVRSPHRSADAGPAVAVARGSLGSRFSWWSRGVSGSSNATLVRKYKRASATPAGFSRIAHSQTRVTCHPASIASLVDRMSRSAFLCIFCSQRAAFGPVQGVVRPWAGHPCQKHPSTKTAKRPRGSTKSGVQPVWIRRWRRKRPPAAWIARRSATSGAVFFALRPAKWRPARVDSH